MPVHDWSRVDSGIFHDFHLEWISRIKGVLNAGLLPPDYYALAEQKASRASPDVPALHAVRGDPSIPIHRDNGGDGGVALQVARPRHSVTSHIEEMLPQRKQRAVVVRHVSGDDVVAIIEVVSPGNKSSRKALEDFVNKAEWLLQRNVHLLILDLHQTTSRDPAGIHGAIWGALSGDPYEPTPGKPLTLAAYEAEEGGYRAYVEPIGVGDRLIDMPLFLRPGAYVEVPLEATYASAFAAVPRRWSDVLDGA